MRQRTDVRRRLPRVIYDSVGARAEAEATAGGGGGGGGAAAVCTIRCCGLQRRQVPAYAAALGCLRSATISADIFDRRAALTCAPCVGSRRVEHRRAHGEPKGRERLINKVGSLTGGTVTAWAGPPRHGRRRVSFSLGRRWLAGARGASAWGISERRWMIVERVRRQWSTRLVALMLVRRCRCRSGRRGPPTAASPRACGSPAAASSSDAALGRVRPSPILALVLSPAVDGDRAQQ